MEFASHAELKPNTSEANCHRVTSPATLSTLLEAYLLTTTGLSWQVRVEQLPMEAVEGQDMPDYLRIRASVSMSVPKDRLGTEPDIGGDNAVS